MLLSSYPNSIATMITYFAVIFKYTVWDTKLAEGVVRTIKIGNWTTDLVTSHPTSWQIKLPAQDIISVLKLQILYIFQYLVSFSTLMLNVVTLCIHILQYFLLQSPDISTCYFPPFLNIPTFYTRSQFILIIMIDDIVIVWTLSRNTVITKAYGMYIPAKGSSFELMSLVIGVKIFPSSSNPSMSNKDIRLSRTLKIMKGVLCS